MGGIMGLKYETAQYEASYGAISQLPSPETPEVAFVGRSNVGKSSLLNKLIGRKQLARVSSVPGKTANINFFDVDGDRQQSIRQGFALSDVIKLMKDKLADKSLIHNSPLLRWSLLNFAVKVGSSGDLMPMKLNENEKIDPVVALIMALQTVIIKGI